MTESDRYSSPVGKLVRIASMSRALRALDEESLRHESRRAARYIAAGIEGENIYLLDAWPPRRPGGNCFL